MFDKRRAVYQYVWWEHGTRRTRVLGHFKNRTAAEQAADKLRTELFQTPIRNAHTPLVNDLVAQFRASKRMPARYSTRRAYDSWFNNHILPSGGITSSQVCRLNPWRYGWTVSPPCRREVEDRYGR